MEWLLWIVNSLVGREVARGFALDDRSIRKIERCARAFGAGTAGPLP
jgi:hypothetical protein